MPQPWQVVADAVRRAIAERAHLPGDRLPSEHQLAELHGVSRPTIRRALRELKLRGLIETRQGKGAFVRRMPSVAITLTADNYRRHQQAGLAGFAAQVREQGYTPRSEVIEVAAVPAPKDVADRLGIDESAAVVVRRLRFFVDDEPVQLVQASYDAGLVAGSRIEGPEPILDGTHAELLRLGIRVTRLVEEFEGARLPDPQVQESLRLPAGVPVVRSIRTAYAGEKPVEVLDATSHGEVVSYRFEVQL